MARSTVLTTTLVVMALILGGCATNSPDQGDNINYGEFRQGSEHPAVLMLFGQADDAMQAGNWSAALTYLDQARRIEPRNPYVLYRQAKAVLSAGDSTRAKQLLERARVFANEDDDMLNYLLYELEFQL
ncbi:tetratricopeptide repeat protein [Thalassolituus maritimus]|uniref:Tetratricopeptide repeat protein n=1 Tax=Thalassolituus maritimus TaxID=484498 RepID=A0ABQ0A2G7_9GAMM